MDQSSATIVLTEIPARREPSPDAARGHIRAALRELAALNVSLNAYASDDQFGQPNRCTVAMDALALALEALS